MKKKSMLMILAAVAASATLGAACSSEPVCEHSNWLTKSDAELHWQECGGCGEKKDYGVHKDSVNNETGATGADGKCDVCGAVVEHVHSYVWNSNHESHWQECEEGDGEHVSMGLHILEDGKCETCGYIQQVEVTFNMHGAGYVEAQNIDYNGKISKPADPEVDGYTFEGWFTDDTFETPFDFDIPVTEPTVVHAKWHAAEIPGANAEHAYDLKLRSDIPEQTFGELNSVYFKHTPKASGRFSVELLTGNSAKCTFTTNKTGEEVFTSDDVVKVDVDAGETLVVVIHRPEGFAGDSKVGFYFDEVTNEDLPDSWLDGEYVFGAYTFTLNKVAKQVYFSYLDNLPHSYNYVGGKFNRLTFKNSNGMVTYNVIPDKDGNLVVSYSSVTVGVFVPYDESAKNPISKFTGYYEPVGAKANGADAIGIEESGNGYVKRGSTTEQKIIGSSGSYWYEKSSTISYAGSGNNYYITLNVDENGNAVSITVRYGESGTACVYTRTSDVLLTKLPVEKNELYVGAVYALGEYYDDIRWGAYNAPLAKVENYDVSTGLFTVTNDKNKFKIKVEISGGAKSFLVYDTEDNLVDTLTAATANVYHELPSSAETNVTVNRSDLKLRTYYFEAKTDGWYSFNSVEDTMELAYSTDGSTYITVPESSYTSAVYLPAGTKGYFKFTGTIKDSFTVTVKNIGEASAPEGTLPGKPVTLDKVGNVEQKYVAVIDEYYYSFEAPRTGTYILTLKTAGISVTVNDEAVSGENKSISFEATAGTPVTFTVSTTDATSFEFLIEDDCTKGTELEFDDEGKGTLNASGVYSYDDLSGIPHAVNVVLGSDDGDEFELIINGVAQSVRTYTFTEETLAYGFVINLEENQTVDYAITFGAGAKQNPVKVTEMGAQNIKGENIVHYFTVTAPEDTDCSISLTSYDGNLLQFTINNVNYGYNYTDGKFVAYDGNVFSLTKGQTVTVEVVCKDDSVNSIDFDFNLFYDFTSASKIDLDTFTAGDKTPDGAFAAYKDIAVSAGDNIFYIPTTHGSNVIITSYSNFTVVNSNATEYTTVSSGGLFNVTIPACEELYFRISSEKDQTVKFVLSYAIGSDVNPYEIKFIEGVSNATELKANTTASIRIPAYGSYEYMCTGYGTLWVNGRIVEKGEVFTVNANDIVKYVTSTSSNIAFAYVMDGTFEFGKYKYDNGEKSVYITANTVVIENKIYKLTSMTSTSYTYTRDTESVTINVDGDTLTYNGNVLTYSPMFSAEAAQTYTGEVSMFGMMYTTLKITITSGGKATVTYDGYIPITATGADISDSGIGSYSFAYTRGDNPGRITFSFGANGVMNVMISESSITPTAPFTPETPWNPSTGGDEEQPSGPEIADIAGEYTGVGSFLGAEATITLTFDEDGNGTFKHESSNGNFSYTITVTKEGAAFTFLYGGNNASFTVNDDGTLSLDTANIGKGIAMKVFVEDMFTAEQAGIYAGTGYWSAASADVPMTLTFDVKGSGTFAWLASKADITITKNGDTYSFSYNGYSASFTFNSDGTLALTTAQYGDAKLTKVKPEVKAGTYKGTNSSGIGYTLIINSQTEAVFKYEDPDDPINETVTMTEDNGVWSFIYLGWVKASFVLNGDGTLTLTDGGQEIYLSPVE